MFLTGLFMVWKIHPHIRIELSGRRSYERNPGCSDFLGKQACKAYFISANVIFLLELNLSAPCLCMLLRRYEDGMESGRTHS
jgi:hypothetical protein